MTKISYSYDASTNEWVFPDGKRLPVISGGDPTADPAAPPVVVVEAPASSTTTVEPPPAPQGRGFTAEDIEKARQQEKDKMYGRLDGLEKQIAAFNEEREAALAAAAAAQAQADAERRAKEEDEMSFKDLLIRKEDEWKSQFETAQTQWAERFGALEAERDAHAALLAKEQEFQRLESYKSRRIQEEGDNLMPELLDFIQGDSEDAIESAISAVAARTSAIVENIQQVTASRPVLRPVPATGQAPSGPSENLSGQQTYTMDQLKNMDMSTYAANRERLMAAVSRR